MKKLYFTYLILQILLIVFMNNPGDARAAGSDGFWKGHQSAQKEPFIKIVEDREEWSGLWKRAFGKPAPEIDFDRQVVACVFLGHRADWLYSISIGEPVRRGGVWIVSYGLAEIILELSGPFKAGGQYVMKVLEKKKDAPMILEETEGSGRRR